MSSKPVALTPSLPSELLSWILRHHVHPTTLIICQPRATFLTSLLRSIPQPIQRQPPPPREQMSDALPRDKEQEVEPEPPKLHPLLIPTLHQIATSRAIDLVFIPTLSHLRAYLSAFPPPLAENRESLGKTGKFDKPGRKIPLFVLYGLLYLHRDTSEWSAQGLGNTLAGLVELGRREGRRVVVIEERRIGVAGEEGNENVWGERVPMLNGSVKRVVLESEDGGWSGRTVEVGRVLARWFKFEKGEWNE